MTNRYAIILAGGQGTRMKSQLKKELHPILKRPMIHYILDALQPLQLDQLVTIVGHEAETMQETIGDVSEYAFQNEQLGTGHAVIQAEQLLKDKNGTTLIICGDTPLMRTETLKTLFEKHEAAQAKATILTTKVRKPKGYGRIVRNELDEVEKIVEEKDANEAEKLIDEINTGTYCFDNAFLFEALKNVNNDNAQGEYYLTDVIEILKNQAELVQPFMTEDEDEILGINDRLALARAEKIMKQRINEKHLLNGVSIMDIDNTYISQEAVIEHDVTIYPGTTILGKSLIQSGAVIGPHTEIEASEIGAHTVIRQSVVENSKIGMSVTIGPYAHIRPESQLSNHVKVGNFVEVKKSMVGEGTKLPHLSYIGDADLGEHINMGCGAITVNYDGKNKHKTVIGDNAFIGCNVNLVAPVTVGADTILAAGSTITKNVPDDALGIARSKQANKEGYAKIIRNTR